MRVFYAASNAPLTLEDDGGATLPLHSTEAPRPQPAWVRAASEPGSPDGAGAGGAAAPAPEADWLGPSTPVRTGRRRGARTCLFTQTASSPASEE